MKFLTTLLAALLFSYSAKALKVIGCDVSEAIIPLPPNQSNLTVPSTQPNSIALGVGVQNYTCNSAGTYTYVNQCQSHLRLSYIQSTDLQEPSHNSSTYPVF